MRRRGVAAQLSGCAVMNDDTERYTANSSTLGCHLGYSATPEGAKRILDTFPGAGDGYVWDTRLDCPVFVRDVQMMEDQRRAAIRAEFLKIIEAAEAKLEAAEREHQYAMQRVVADGDEEDARFTAAARAETAAEVYALNRVVDALIGAEIEALGPEHGA